MDPTETMHMMLRESAAGNVSQACGHARDLQRWLDGGGFVPKGWDRDACRREIAHVLGEF